MTVWLSTGIVFQWRFPLASAPSFPVGAKAEGFGGEQPPSPPTGGVIVGPFQRPRSTYPFEPRQSWRAQGCRIRACGSRRATALLPGATPTQANLSSAYNALRHAKRFILLQHRPCILQHPSRHCDDRHLLAASACDPREQRLILRHARHRHPGRFHQHTTQMLRAALGDMPIVVRGITRTQRRNQPRVVGRQLRGAGSDVAFE